MVRKKLSDIVKSYMDLQERSSPHKFAWFMRIAKRGYTELWDDISGEPFKAIIPVDKTNNTAVLPDNFKREILVYVLAPTGELISLTRNDNLAKNVDDCGIMENGEINRITVPMFPSATINQNFQNIGGRYGIGGRSVFGDFKIDEQMGRVLLSSDFSHDEIYLLYTGDPLENNGDYEVHPFLEQPIRDYIYWQSVALKDSVPMSEKQNRFDNYVNSKLWAANQLTSMTVQEVKDLSKKNFTLAPKL
jgi:hypothetical protein